MKNYTIPKIYKGTGVNKNWYIWFRFNGTLVKKTGDINRIEDLKEREKEAKIVQQYYLDKLKRDWNPLTKETPEPTKDKGEVFTLSKALDFAIDKKSPNLSHKTINDYKGTLRFIKSVLKDVQMQHILITEVKRVHIKSILEAAKKKRAWSNKSYNKHLGHLQAILSELIQWDIIEGNPAHNIKKMPVEEVLANRPPTPEELIRIKNHLSKNYPDFFNFVACIFHTGIRPVELTRLKIGMITKHEIILPGIITKNKKMRIVPINIHLAKIFEAMLKNKPSKDYYLFGSKRQSGRGNVGDNKDFVVGCTKMSRDTATRRWEKTVKIELGIDVNLYGMKKAGANAKIMAGMNIRTLQELFGHQSELTTEIYITNLRDVIRQEILEKSPDF